MLSKEDIDRIFAKQMETDTRNKEIESKDAEKWYRDEWLRKKLHRGFSNDLMSQDKRFRRDRKSQVVAAKFEAHRIEDGRVEQRKEKYYKMLKRGILEGAIQIHETPDGFEVDTPPEKVAEYFLNHFRSNVRPSHQSDLAKGKFLLGTVDNFRKRRIANLRQNLIQEYAPKTASDFMLIDLAASNYARCMFATKLETECLWLGTEHVMEMFEVAVEGLQPYIHACQNQLLRTLRTLKATKQGAYAPGSFTYETYSRTRINVGKWGLPFLLALAEITEEKEQQIDIDEIKQTMRKFIDEPAPETIPNSWIGYALRYYGLTDKIHVTEGNQYNITKQQVHTILNEELNG